MSFANYAGWGMVVFAFLCVSIVPWRMVGESWRDSFKYGFRIICAVLSFYAFISIANYLIKL